MKLPSKSLCLVVASAALVFAAGCSKKPARPDPSATVIGPQGGGAGSGGALNPTDVASTTPNDLAPRSDFDQSGQNRTALAAQTVYFAFDRSEIRTSERPKLQAAKDYLDKNPGQRLLLEGHCDWRGTAEYNLALGDRRANAAKKYLQSLGVSADKLDTVSKGSLEATKNADAATMAKERSVILVVVQAGGGTAPMGAAGTAAPAAGTGAPADAGAQGGTTPPPTGGL